ncbi:MAG: phage head morphogenesis protein [Bacteroidales bacterium]|jgi:hypothetical protein|nr:phage head morphogenesis protein [Bacteroidales bacterium]
MVVDEIYYGNDGAPHFHNESNPAVVEHGFVFDSDVLENALKTIYEQKFNPVTEIEYNMFKETFRCFNLATQKGTKGFDMDKVFVDQLNYNNAVYSAFRVHRLQNDIAAKLIGSDGKLKSFRQFSQDAMPIASHSNGVWLQTEYNTAVRRAHIAAQWQHYEKNKDILPNVRWMPSTSITPGEDHRVFWGTVLPVNDDFWNRHKPGDRWNCKCDLESTGDATTGTPTKQLQKKDIPQPGLENNPGKDAKLFSNKAPMIANAHPGAKKAVDDFLDKEIGKSPIETQKVKSLAAIARKKQLDKMEPLLDEKIKKIVKNEKEINVGFTKYGNKHLYSDTFGKKDKQIKISDLKGLEKKLKKATYYGESDLVHTRKDDIKYFYYFKDPKNEIYYHVAEKRNTTKENVTINRFLYSITKRPPKLKK